MLRIFLLGIFLVGCMGMSKTSIFNTEPYMDTVTDDTGRTLLADTPRNWRDWTEVMDRHIAREIEGQGVSGGYDSWNKFWEKIIGSLTKNTENYQKYIIYIIDIRRKSGLPELVFEEKKILGSD